MSKKIQYNKPVTADYARELRSKAIVGKTKKEREDALQELINRNKALAKLANSRLSRLEKAGFTRYAYDRAISFTESEYGMERFTVSANKLTNSSGDLNSYIINLQFNIQEMSKFINSKASTVSGNHAIDLSIVDAFREKGINIPKGQENEFLDLIASDDFETLKKTYVDSGTIIMDMVRLTNDSDYKVSMSDIEKAFSKVVDNQLTYDVALEELGYKI